MPVENADTPTGNLNDLRDLQEATKLDPRLLTALQGDAKRRGGKEYLPYANDEYVYYVSPRGVILWSQRGATKGVIQYIRQTGQHLIHPTLARQGYRMIHEVCEGVEDGEEFKRLRHHIDHHQYLMNRGRKNRLRLRIPYKDLPTEILRRMIAPVEEDYDEGPRAHVRSGTRQHKEITKILQERDGGKANRSKA